MNQVSGHPLGGFAEKAPDEVIASGQVGSILWQSDPAEINRLQHIAVEKSRLHIPLLCRLRCDSRLPDRFPRAAGHGFVVGSGRWRSRRSASPREDARAAGIDWTFTPMVDIARDARWGRIVEGAGEDPYLGAAMARAQVHGFQGDGICALEQRVACVKHFAGYGAADGGRDYDSSYIPERTNAQRVPGSVSRRRQAGAGSFMSAYMDLNDVPATGNRWLLHDVLRKEWGFEGFVVSDAMAVGEPGDARLRARSAKTPRCAPSPPASTWTWPADLRSGILPQLVKEERVKEAELDEAVLPAA